jgi:acyl-CoA synthetase (NDP forming)
MADTKKKNRKNHESLSESESKKILSGYGVPVIVEKIAGTKKEAVRLSEETGFPVVVKGLGAKLTHKTERGLVHLNLENEKAVTDAADAISKGAGNDLEGFLVQPFLTGKREFVAGMFRDQMFGPVIMFGLGGVFTEALSDVSFRLAPLTDIDIKEMIGEIRSQKLLGDFRGEKKVNMEAIIRTLKGLSDLSMADADIAEIDINPLLVQPDGNIVAVDALIVKGKTVEHMPYTEPVSLESIRFFFYPKPIAFIGATTTMGKWGHTLPTNTVSGDYKGEIYLVNPKGGTIINRTAYKSVADIPGKVDLVVVTIPASKVMELIPQLQAKGIKDMLLISSGFGETGEEGKKLEKELVQKAKEAGILLLGPNTMGICNPHIDLYCTGVHVRPRKGSTSIVSQSGNMGTQLLAFAYQQDIGIRGFCGSGNEAMLTIEDFLDAFLEDELTKTVMLYVESVKNGRRFFESAKNVSKKKPIVLLKGGRSKAGNIAASSHTGALTSDTRVFDAMCKQAGIINVNQSLEMLDLAASFSSLPLPTGNRVAIMTLGGGWGVVTADLCEYYNLTLPRLSPEIKARIDKILPPYWSKANPIDLVGENDNRLPMTVLEELMKWDGCDAVINLGIMGKRIMTSQLVQSVAKADGSYSREFLDSIVKMITDFEKRYVEHVVNLMETYKKPIYGVNIITDAEDKTVYRVEGKKHKAVFFPTPERAVKSLARMAEYRRFLDTHP